MCKLPSISKEIFILESFLSLKWPLNDCYVLITSGYLIVTTGYLIITTGYLIVTTGYFLLLLVTSCYILLLLVPHFSNSVISSSQL